MAIAELPSHDAALDAAIALDQFCANVDVQIGISQPGRVFSGNENTRTGGGRRHGARFVRSFRALRR